MPIASTPDSRGPANSGPPGVSSRLANTGKAPRLSTILEGQTRYTFFQSLRTLPSAYSASNGVGSFSIHHVSAAHHGEPTNTTLSAILRVQFKGPQGPGSRQGPVFPRERRKRGRPSLRAHFDFHDGYDTHDPLHFDDPFRARQRSQPTPPLPARPLQQKIIIVRQAAAGLCSATSPIGQTDLGPTSSSASANGQKSPVSNPGSPSSLTSTLFS